MVGDLIDIIAVLATLGLTTSLIGSKTASSDFSIYLTFLIIFNSIFGNTVYYFSGYFSVYEALIKVLEY